MSFTPRTRNSNHSRLQRQESKRVAKQTFLLIVLSIIILSAIFIVGIPALIKLSVLLSKDNETIVNEKNDNIPPVNPQLIVPPEATTSATIRLSGYSEAGSTVRLFNNNVQTSETLTTNEGQFEFLEIKLEEGINQFYTIAFDSAGNESVRSSTQTVILDTKKPLLELTKPAANQQFYGLNEQTITIEGKTDNDATVTINDRHIVVRGDGTFSTRHPLTEGDNTLKVKAVDRAGNETALETTVKYSK